MSVDNKIYKRETTKDGEGFERESWRTFGDGKQVLITCKHGNNALIAGRGDGKDWGIAPDGTVTPSVYWRGTCECHIHVRLDGWRR